MNLSCGSRTIKYLIFTFNFFFVITGIILIAVGASIHTYYTKYDFFLNSEYFSLPNMLIATGTFIFLICFLGCYGAIKNSWIMLMAFSLLLGIIFIFEFSAGIAGYVLRDKTEKYLTDSLTTAMDKYNSSSSTATMWDLVQTTFTCCGVNSYKDWEPVMKNTDLPISCCPTKAGTSGSFYCNAVTPTISTSSSETTSSTPSTNSTPTTTIKTTPSTTSSTVVTNEMSTTTNETSAQHPNPTSSRRKRRDVSQPATTTSPYNIGCETAFGKWVKAHAVDIGAVCFTLAVLQLIGIGFSCHLSKQLKNSYYST
ncbi:leukocyte surface antigen CD53-like isoform X2 [Diabrotica virgifera virgifera]|uniref:Tetraspanin n=1 Tax=Diabrotica virgifera virgifera TaxID=50390 RepID=A0ABM5JPQ3_DIAVI|nr:leukocyte surface antigen CD53-like isoform X2 [Diabrotica virgifera virgifera]